MATTAKKKPRYPKKSTTTPWWVRLAQLTFVTVLVFMSSLYVVSAQQAAHAQQLFKGGQYDQAIDQMELAQQYFPIMPRQDQISRFSALKTSTEAYQQGLADYQRQDWQSAAVKFKLVSSLDAQYKSAQEYLHELQTKEDETQPVVLTQISQLPGLEVGLDAAGQLQVPILMYHYISENRDPADQLRTELSVPPATFANHMQYLVDHGYHTVSLQQVTDTLNGIAVLPPKPVVLTFDDGYVDFYQNAYPILFRHQLKASLMVITDYSSNDSRYTTWDQIKLMASGGLIEIGSHTLTHPDLRQLSDSQLAHELTQSKRALETQLGQTINLLCYPIGGVNDRVVTAAQAAGYTTAVTTEYGSWHRPDQLLKLSRIRIKNQPMSNYLAD